MTEQPTRSRAESRGDLADARVRDTRLRDRPAIRDVLYAIVFMFAAGALIALVHQFPVPFGGHVSGIGGAWEAIVAMLIYGLAGGFIVVPLLAAGAGALLRRRGFPGHGPIAAIPPFLVALLTALALTLVIG